MGAPGRGAGVVLRAAGWANPLAPATGATARATRMTPMVKSRPFKPPKESTIAYIGLGANLGERERTIAAALRRIDEDERTSLLRSTVPFETELELTLKKEYSAGFGLFRYCVLTQDATYLCNKLDLQYVPQPSYPFFHVKMEDVWVWDKNRPTRIIPRAEIYTSSDVTVEELRGENDEPRVTAEALAEKIGESLSSEDDL